MDEHKIFQPKHDAESGEVEHKTVPLRGIPDSAFSITLGKRRITGKSGRPLGVNIRKDSVYIVDEQHGHYFFDARVEDGTLRFTVKNYDSNPADALKNDKAGKAKLRGCPDIYPKDLLFRSYQFFIDNGVQIDFVKLNWFDDPKLGTNYEAYYEEIAGLLQPTEQQLEQAVFATWSGQLMAELGFAEVEPENGEFIHTEEGVVSVRLRKTKEVRFTFQEVDGVSS